MIRTYFNARADEVKKNTDYDGYSTPQLETIGYDVDCRKKETIKLVRNNQGKEVVSNVEVWLPPDVDILPTQSQLIFGDETFEVIKSGYVSGISDKKFLRVFLK